VKRKDRMIRDREKALVSACLLGVACRYDGGHEYDREVEVLRGKYDLVPVCPEQLGGLSTPRPAAEIRGGAGEEVLSGTARVETLEGDHEVTDAFLRGAEAALRIAGFTGARAAFLKSRSPSCGCGSIVVAGKEVKGDGVTTALLKRHGITVESWG